VGVVRDVDRWEPYDILTARTGVSTSGMVIACAAASACLRGFDTWTTRYVAWRRLHGPNARPRYGGPRRNPPR